MSDITTSTVGKLLDESAQRDAIHMALAPVISGENTPLPPGTHVSVIDGDRAVIHGGQRPIGIVDPFLPGPVLKGERFWLWLYPDTITSLRHQWTHPAFGEVPNARHPNYEVSRKWLEDFGRRMDYGYQDGWTGISFDDVVAGAVDTLDSDWKGSDVDFPGGYMGGPQGAITPEFWEHIEVVTGRTVPRDTKRGGSFCACG